MAIEKVGNLGQIALIGRLLDEKKMRSYSSKEDVTLTNSELKEVEQALHDFEYVLRNLYMWENNLEKDQYGGLLKVLRDMKEKDY